MKPTLKLSLVLIMTLICGSAMAQKAGMMSGPYTGQRIPMERSAPPAVPFYSNLVANTCTGCNYDTNNGFLILGPTNCEFPGSTQWFAYPFVSAKSGTIRNVFASITDWGICTSTAKQVTVAIYSDACGLIPATQIGSSANANLPAAPCLLAKATFRTGAPVLTAGTNYWVVVTTTSPTQDGTTAVWWEANNAPASFNLNDGNGWGSQLVGSPGGFMVQ